MNRSIALGISLLLGGWTMIGAARADSAISLLSGFDTARIEAAYPPEGEEAAGELAKLLYRLRSIDPVALQKRVGESANVELGDAVVVDGEILEIKLLPVPSRLVEFLELSNLDLLVVSAGESTVRLVTTSLPREAKPGDRVSGAGVAIDIDPTSGLQAVATPRLRWFPKTPESVGWKLLSEAGVDVSLLAELGTRNRRPLLAEDGDAFYSILAAAGTLGARSDLPTPQLVDPVVLLTTPENLGGQWLRMDLETVQVTRISVTEPGRQSQLGSDHYFQIDAVGDLGNVIVKIEQPVGEVGPPALFENRYPVSIVTRELPEFLQQAVRTREGGDAVVSQIKLLIGADVFFYRLWSYQTDFMTQFGKGEQFGPLLIASRIHNQQPISDDPAGVGMIGWIAAAAVILGIAATWLWNRRVSSRDLEVRERRKTRESERLQLP